MEAKEKEPHQEEPHTQGRTTQMRTNYYDDTKQLLKSNMSMYSANLTANDKPIKLIIYRRFRVNGIVDHYKVDVVNESYNDHATLTTDDGETGTLQFESHPLLSNKYAIKNIREMK